MLLNYYEESVIKNTKLPDEWQSQSSLDELATFLQLNWEQRAVFYNDGQISSRQQFLEFTAHMLYQRLSCHRNKCFWKRIRYRLEARSQPCRKNHCLHYYNVSFIFCSLWLSCTFMSGNFSAR